MKIYNENTGKKFKIVPKTSTRNIKRVSMTQGARKVVLTALTVLFLFSTVAGFNNLKNNNNEYEIVDNFAIENNMMEDYDFSEDEKMTIIKVLKDGNSFVITASSPKFSETKNEEFIEDVVENIKENPDSKTSIEMAELMQGNPLFQNAMANDVSSKGSK